jgi:signal transduction histidine kinase
MSAVGVTIDGCGRRLTRSATLAITAAMAVLTGVALFGALQGGNGNLAAFDVLLAVLACGLVPLLLRYPLPVGFALGVLAALSPVVTPVASFAVLWNARQLRFRVALAMAVTGVAGQAIQGTWRSTTSLGYGWWLLLMTLIYAGLLGWGALARSRAALLISLQERAHRAETEQGRRVAQARLAERTRIAREMHDVLAHRLSLVATYAGALEYRPDASPQQLSQAAGVVRAGVHQALDELRQVISVLRSDGEDDGADEGDRPQPVLADVTALVDESRAAGMPVRLDNRVDADAVPVPVGRTAYRVVQEALTNARKHAPGTPVVVLLDGEPGGRLTLDVRNPVAGPPAGNGGLGLLGMTERVALAGGELDHGIADGREFHLRAWLPWPA